MKYCGTRGIQGFQKKLVWPVLIFVVAFASIFIAQVPQATGSVTTVVRVNAAVLARTQLTPLRQPSMLVVTDADIQRGYVDVSGASLFEIWNNMPAGCILTFESSGFPFQEVAVTVMGREIILYPTGGMIVLPVRGRQQVSLDYRFVLTSEARSGTYAWPLSISVNQR